MMLLILGVPTPTAMALMGWSSAAMAKHYQHLIDTIRRDVAKQVGGLLRDADDASAEHVARANETTNETRPDAEPGR
jgi:integrase